MRQKLLLLAAVFFGVLAFMFTWQQISYEKQLIKDSTEDRVVIVLKEDMAEGDAITADKITGRKVKRFKNSLNTNEIPFEHRDQIIDAELALNVRANTPLMYSYFKTAIRKDGRSGLARTLEPGRRAIPVPVDMVSSVAGLVRPYNYVDVIGTFRFPDAKGDAQLDTITMTILQRVKVLACGSDTGNQSSGGSAARSYSTVTLELLPHEVEMIVFAIQKGRLTLSLRNADDGRITDTQSVDWNSFRENIDKLVKEREKMR